MRKIRICFNGGRRNRAVDLNYSSNARGRDRGRIFEFARMCKEEIAREYLNLLEYGREKSCGRFKFAQMRVGEISRED